MLCSLLAVPFESVLPLHPCQLPLYAGLNDVHDNRLIWTSETGTVKCLPVLWNSVGSMFRVIPGPAWCDLKLTTGRVQAEIEQRDTWAGALDYGSHVWTAVEAARYFGVPGSQRVRADDPGIYDPTRLLSLPKEDRGMTAGAAQQVTACMSAL